MSAPASPTMMAPPGVAAALRTSSRTRQIAAERPLSSAGTRRSRASAMFIDDILGLSMTVLPIRVNTDTEQARSRHPSIHAETPGLGHSSEKGLIGDPRAGRCLYRPEDTYQYE